VVHVHCTGTRVNFTTYFESEGHDGCSQGGTQIVECWATIGNCRSLPPGWICLTIDGAVWEYGTC
jgi:hypothetical protein